MQPLTYTDGIPQHFVVLHTLFATHRKCQQCPSNLQLAEKFSLCWLALGVDVLLAKQLYGCGVLRRSRATTISLTSF